MIKIRSLKDALLHIKSLDADTGITINAIRILVVSGIIPSVKIGRKYLVNLDLVIEYFENTLSGTVPEDDSNAAIPDESCEDIHPIPDRIKRRRY